MQEIGGSRKLLFGLCLLALSGKATCAPISAEKEEKFNKQWTPRIDDILHKDLNCPSHVADEVKLCIAREVKINVDEFCTGMKKEWDCLKFGMLKCQDGPRFVEFVGPVINGIARSHGCLTVTTSATMPQHNSNSRNENAKVTDLIMVNKKEGSSKAHPIVVVGGIFLMTVFTFLGCLLVLTYHKNRNSEAQKGMQ